MPGVFHQTVDLLQLNIQMNMSRCVSKTPFSCIFRPSKLTACKRPRVSDRDYWKYGLWEAKRPACSSAQTDVSRFWLGDSSCMFQLLVLRAGPRGQAFVKILEDNIASGCGLSISWPMNDVATALKRNFSELVSQRG